MTTNAMASPAVPIQLAAKDKRAILENVLAALRKRFYSPEKLDGDWHAAIERHKVQIESPATHLTLWAYMKEKSIDHTSLANLHHEFAPPEDRILNRILQKDEKVNFTLYA
jgi:hypothetical protein